ncbi:MAG: LPS export ABC transporter permease LptF [Dokdonella sp.]
MLRIVDRYLLRELTQGFLAAAAILLLVTVGGAVADVLGQVVRGKVPVQLLMSLIGLQTVNGLVVLLPLAIFLGVLLALGRLYRDSEMAVLAASGLALRGVLRPLAMLAIPVTLLLAVISLWLAPASQRLAQSMLADANRSILVAGLEPGRFVRLPGRDGIIYVGEMSDDGSQFKRMFIETESADDTSNENVDKKDSGTRADIITAPSGYMYRDAASGARYLALEDGFRAEGKLGSDAFRLMRFERNDIGLPDDDSSNDSSKAKLSATLGVLWRSDDPAQRAELHWRIAAPIAALTLVLLALPLARSNPREPRHARLMIAILAWMVFANGMALTRSWMAQDKWPAWAGYWWLFLLTIAISVWLIRRGQQLRRPRTRRRASA